MDFDEFDEGLDSEVGERPDGVVTDAVDPDDAVLDIHFVGNLVQPIFVFAEVLGELTATFDGRAVPYEFGDLDTLVPAYATTIHKRQGSEYPAVIIPVMTQHYTMLHRNLIYTGVTRGKRLVVLVGQKKAVAIAVRNVSGRRRWSKLAEWLRSAQSKA